MNEEKQNQTYYKETFREVHAPQDLVERLMNMDELKNRKKTNFTKKWLAAAGLTIAFLFAGSNGVAYAMTGTTWLETLVYKITLDDVDYYVELEEHKKENGKYWYIGSVQHENGDVTEVKYEEHGASSTLMIHTKESASVSLKDGRVRILDGEIEIDVTEELLEVGVISGSYERNGYTKIYKITKEGDCITPYIVTVQDDMEKAWQKVRELEEASKQQSDRMFATPTPTPVVE